MSCASKPCLVIWRSSHGSHFLEQPGALQRGDCPQRVALQINAGSLWETVSAWKQKALWSALAFVEATSQSNLDLGLMGGHSCYCPPPDQWLRHLHPLRRAVFRESKRRFSLWQGVGRGSSPNSVKPPSGKIKNIQAQIPTQTNPNCHSMPWQVEEWECEAACDA